MDEVISNSVTTTTRILCASYVILIGSTYGCSSPGLPERKEWPAIVKEDKNDINSLFVNFVLKKLNQGIC